MERKQVKRKGTSRREDERKQIVDLESQASRA
jgi:hypothetical protein